MFGNSLETGVQKKKSASQRSLVMSFFLRMMLELLNAPDHQTTKPSGILEAVTPDDCQLIMITIMMIIIIIIIIMHLISRIRLLPPQFLWKQLRVSLGLLLINFSFINNVV